MKSLIQALCILSLLALPGFAVAGGAEVVGGVQPPEGRSPKVPVPVSNVSVTLFRGCGQDPQGFPCPDSTEIRFTVEVGGSCHAYSVTQKSKSDRTVLTILDSVLENCSRPEQQNYEALITLDGNLGGKPVVIGNPVYTKTYYRP